jgi:hypothetical protein
VFPGWQLCFISSCCCGGLQARQGGAGCREGVRAAPEEAVRDLGAGAQAAACSGGGGACAGRLLLGGARGRARLGRGMHRGDAGR